MLLRKSPFFVREKLSQDYSGIREVGSESNPVRVDSHKPTAYGFYFTSCPRTGKVIEMESVRSWKCGDQHPVASQVSRKQDQVDVGSST